VKRKRRRMSPADREAARLRKRLERKRASEGKMPVIIDIDNVTVPEDLIASGHILPHQSEDRKAIGSALSQHYELLSRRDAMRMRKLLALAYQRGFLSDED
jgi:hypothetical protein